MELKLQLTRPDRQTADGFLVTQYSFVRGLPVERRMAASVLDQGLHIVAVPSNPISDRLVPPDIEGEWTRLISIIRKLTYAITLERTGPPMLEHMRELGAGQRHRVVHCRDESDLRQN